MRARVAGVQPVSARGVLFLVAFVSFLALAMLGPHVHGVDSTPAVSVSAATTSGVAQVGEPAPGSGAGSGAGSAASAPGQATEATPSLLAPAAAPELPGGEQTLGFGAVCVLVLLVSLAILAAKASLTWASLRRGPLVLLQAAIAHPRAHALPLFRLLSISRT